jgi:hypothetical protein
MCSAANPSNPWTNRAKNHRHALGHHLDRFRANMNLVERELGDQLLWLAELCLLREADAPAAVFERISEDSHFRWVAHNGRCSGPSVGALLGGPQFSTWGTFASL